MALEKNPIHTPNRRFSLIDIGTSLIGGAALAALSSGIFPVALGVAAIGAGVWKAVDEFTKFTKPSLAADLFFSVAKIGAAVGLLTHLGSVGVPAAIGLGATALTMTLAGGVGVLGSVFILFILGLRELPNLLVKLDKKMSGPAPKEPTPSSEPQPVSKLDDTEAKTGFNASAEKPAAPETLSPQPKNPPQP